MPPVRIDLRVIVSSSTGIAVRLVRLLAQPKPLAMPSEGVLIDLERERARRRQAGQEQLLPGHLLDLTVAHRPERSEEIGPGGPARDSSPPVRADVLLQRRQSGDLAVVEAGHQPSLPCAPNIGPKRD